MNLRDWSDDDVRRTASALAHVRTADLVLADALLATVPGLEQQLSDLSVRPRDPSGPAGSSSASEAPPSRAWEFARWLYRHGRLSDDGLRAS